MSFPSIEFYAQPYAVHDVINAFFVYSFFGWVMECIVIRHDTGVWENRGFVRLPLDRKSVV